MGAASPKVADYRAKSRQALLAGLRVGISLFEKFNPNNSRPLDGSQFLRVCFPRRRLDGIGLGIA
jgi:hypothetical protein